MSNQILKIFVIYTCSFVMAFSECLAMSKGPRPSTVQEYTLFEKINKMNGKITSAKEKEKCDELDKQEKKAADEKAPANKSNQRIVFQESVEPLVEESTIGPALTFEDIFKTNSCHWGDDGVTKEEEEEKPESCKYTLGLLENVHASIKEQDEDKETYLIIEDDNAIKALNQIASIRPEVERFITNGKIKRKLRQQMTLEYLEKIYLPLYEILFIADDSLFKSPKIQTLLGKITLRIPRRLFSFSDDQYLLRLGPNPYQNPLNLEIIELNKKTITVIPNLFKRTSRNIAILMKSQSYTNYFRAIRSATINMMLSQLALYDTISADKSNLFVPNSCQSFKNNNLPASIPYNKDFQEKQGNVILENIISSYGLAHNDEEKFENEYLENSDIDFDPLTEAHQGPNKFESLKSSEEFLKYNSVSSNIAFDDIAHYDLIMKHKLNRVKELYSIETGSMPGGFFIEKDHSGMDIWGHIFAVPGEEASVHFLDAKGERKSFKPSWSNLSLYLSDYMRRNKLTDLEDALSDEIKDELTHNDVIIDFPAFYGSPTWRQWALSEMGTQLETLAASNDNDFSNRLVKLYCNKNSFKMDDDIQFCNRSTNINDEGNVYSFLAEKIERYRNSSNYIPLDKLEKMKINQLWPFFRIMWESEMMAGQREMNEFDFIMTQLNAGNPWARIRLSYLVAKEELEKVAAESRDRFSSSWTNGFGIFNENGQCQKSAIDDELARFRSAAKIINIDKTLSLNYGSKILSNKETKKLWAELKGELEDGSKNLMTNSSRGIRGQSYKLIDEVNNYSLIDRKSLIDTAEKLSTFEMEEKTKAKISKIFDSELGKMGDFYLGLYREKGNIEVQQEIFEEFLKDKGLREVNDFDIKKGFLKIDNLVKMEIYKDILRDSAKSRRELVLKELDKICRFEVDDIDEIKTMFYMTSKVQSEVSKQLGLPGVPANVLDRINGWNREDWVGLRDGLLSGFLGMGGIGLAKTCTLAPQVCASIWPVILLGGAAVIMSGGSIYFGARLINYEYRKFTNKNIYMGQIKRMADLGFTDHTNINELNHGWVMLAVETVSLIPLLGISARGFNIGRRFFKTATKNMNNKSRGRTFFTELGNNFDKEDSSYALDILKAKSKNNAKYELQIVEKQKMAALEAKELAAKKMKGIISQDEFVRGATHISNKLEEEIGKILKHKGKDLDELYINLSRTEVDDLVSDGLVNYYGDLKSFNKTFRRLSGKNLDNAINNMENKLANSVGLDKMYLKLRSEHLYKYREKIRTVQKNLDSALLNGTDPKVFFKANMDDLTNIHYRAPFEKRSFPHMIVVQGANHGTEYTLGKGQKIFGGADRMMTQKLFKARARLHYDITIAEKKREFGLASHVGAVEVRKVLKQFDHNVKELISDNKIAVNEYRAFQKEASEVVWSSLKKSRRFDSEKQVLYVKVDGQEYTILRDNLDSFLFEYDDIGHEAIADFLWSAADPKKIIKVEGIDDFAHLVVKDLADKKGVNAFIEALNTAKVLIYNGKPDLIDYM